LTTNSLPGAGLPYLNLPARLDALAELVRIGATRGGQDGFPPDLLHDCDGLLQRAGERLRLSASHTVVAIAGGTGSGKSSLFNALAGANFSPIGVTRPTTRHVHACVWGVQGVAPLLDWLGVQRRHRYARASALDAGEVDLDGLLLLDLPDHDSVVAASKATVDRLNKLADMLIWVLDPQKYADNAVHTRYLIPLASHSSLITVVLNQIDVLTPEQVDDCESDLRRLLDSEGLENARLLPVSARTGAGLEDLRNMLVSAVSASNASSERIARDIDAALEGFAAFEAEPVAPVTLSTPVVPEHSNGSGADAAAPSGASGVYGEEPGHDDDPGNGASPRLPAKPPWDLTEEEILAAYPPRPPARPPWEQEAPKTASPEQNWAASVPGLPAAELGEALARAAGITALCDAIQGASEARAGRYVAWPLASLGHLRRRSDPLRGLGTGPSGRGPRAIAIAAGQPRQSDIDNAITAFADQVTASLPEPWARTTREAARSRAEEVPAALGAAITGALDVRDRLPFWVRLVRLWQWLLIAIIVAGLAWIGAVIAFGVEHVSRTRVSTLLSETSLLPWLAVMVVAVVLLGWLTSSGSQNMMLLAADRDRERVERQLSALAAAVARDLVLAPTGREIVEYERFRHELGIARGTVAATEPAQTPAGAPGTGHDAVGHAAPAARPDPALA
jgi:GTP-binding protein EngB required for normal cell division